MKKLDLPTYFNLKAKELLHAIENGRLVHAAGNIKASGSCFELIFRDLLAESLPSTNKVMNGYFYDATSRCSAEVDVLVYEDEEAFRLAPIRQEQHYIPYTSVSILGQLKHSARDLSNAIEQVQGNLNTWHEMQRELSSAGVTSDLPYQHEPLTFIICGDCSEHELKNLKEVLKNKGRPLVDYVLLLKPGLIVTGFYDVLNPNREFIDFLCYRDATCLYLCEPVGSLEHPQGVALLWFYFALVSKLSLDRGNNLRYQAFCRKIAMLYQLRPLEKLL